MAGPLAGVKVVELAGMGPAPFGVMLLADLGAEVILIDRADRAAGLPLEASKTNVGGRGRRSVGVNLKSAEGIDIVHRLIDEADVFVEGFRPGVAERLGLGPDDLRSRNPRLVYARMTGWGQTGPLADRAGHDINYLGLAGPLAHMGRAGGPPTPPLNLVADFGGGGMLLALGVCAALVERASSDQGQVVDAAMVDGVALLGSMIQPAYEMGFFSDERGTNLLDTGAPFYDTYETADGMWMSVGALEPQFYAALLEVVGLAGEDLPDQNDESGWPTLRARFAEVFATKTQADWVSAFEGIDACVAPIHTFRAAGRDDHLVARGTYVDVDGVVQAGPGPRFDRTPAELDRPPASIGFHTVEVLHELGFGEDDIATLRKGGAIA